MTKDTSELDTVVKALEFYADSSNYLHISTGEEAYIGIPHSTIKISTEALAVINKHKARLEGQAMRIYELEAALCDRIVERNRYKFELACCINGKVEPIKDNQND